MRKFGAGLIAVAVVGMTAAPVAAQQGQIVRLGDAGLSCPQIATEAGQLTEALGGAPEGGVFTSEQAIGAATAAATQTALLSGAGRALPGVGFLGSALGAMARRDRERREAEAVVARQRWYYLNGLYTGRDCDRVLAEAAAPAAAPAVEPAPVEAAPSEPEPATDAAPATGA